MKKTSLLLILVLLVHLGNPAHAQALPLSGNATASVLTCGPGNEFYLAFGHSAIRITDTALGLDNVYNYGTFDFDTPHFYWNFARGMMNYCLSRTSFDRFEATYDHEQRAVWEQRLNLTQQEVNNLYIMLEWNYQPENRYYQYDFFRDNCATRVRDMVEAAYGHTPLRYCEELAGRSYRRYVHESTAGGCLEWWTLGIDLLLGLPADHRCDVREVMFHPIHMMNTFGQSHLGSNETMVQPTHQHLTDHREPLRRSFPPLVVFALVFAVVTVLSWRGWWRPWMDRVLFFVAGIIGLVLLFMWFGTDHWCTKWNLNILWASPLLILIAIRHKKSPAWGLWLQEACFLVAAVWVVVCGLSWALLPVILTLALRVACLIPRKPQQQQQPR